MSDLRVRRATRRRRGLLAFLFVPLLVALGCGSGESEEPSVRAGIALPEVGTLGRQPKGPGTIVVDVTAGGHISIGEQGPLSLAALRDELARLTADEAWREPDRSSLKVLLVNADASLPWTVAQWIMQSAAEPQVALYRIFFGALARDDGTVGAVGWALPKDRCGGHDGTEPPPRLAVSVVPREDVPSEPEDLLVPLRAAAGERPLADLTLALSSRGGRNGEIPTGFMVRVADVALRAGVRKLEFNGASLVKTFELDDVEGLLDHVAELRRRLRAPVLKVAKERVAALPTSEPVPAVRGRLDHLYGSGVEEEEPDPARAKFEVTVGTDVREEELEEPVIKDEVLEDPVETGSDLPFEETLGAEGPTDAPFDGPSGEPFVGPSAVPGAFPTRERSGERDPPVERALQWLAAHQSPNGGWEAAGFGRWCDGTEVVEQDRADGWGRPTHDVGVTGLALCAFLGAGYTNRGRHPYASTVSKGLRHLKHVQDVEGCFGPRTHDRFAYDHAAAALAMVEAYGMTRSPIFKGSAQRALAFILQCRNPGGVWRYGVRSGENDTSVTAWMAMPLYAAFVINQDAERLGQALPLQLDGGPWSGIEVWLGALTSAETGRTGYRERGGRPDRPEDLVAWFPPERSESTTAAAVLLRIFLQEDPGQSAILQKGAALLEGLPPVWDAEAGTVDHVYWYFGVLATFQIGGQPWATWHAALQDAVLGTQRLDTDACRYRGSWDPIGPWGREGGRVASTALLALCLEAHDRYARVFRAR